MINFEQIGHDWNRADRLIKLEDKGLWFVKRQTIQVWCRDACSSCVRRVMTEEGGANIILEGIPTHPSAVGDWEERVRVNH